MLNESLDFHLLMGPDLYEISWSVSILHKYDVAWTPVVEYFRWRALGLYVLNRHMHNETNL